jgi:hypothetical protein
LATVGKFGSKKKLTAEAQREPHLKEFIAKFWHIPKHILRAQMMLDGFLRDS